MGQRDHREVVELIDELDEIDRISEDIECEVEQLVDNGQVYEALHLILGTN